MAGPLKEGLELFDAALQADDAVLVAARLDFAALRAQAASESGHVLLRGLVRAGRRAAPQATSRGGGLAEQLAATPPVQREQNLLPRPDYAAALSDLFKCYRGLGLMDLARACQEEARKLL